MNVPAVIITICALFYLPPAIAYLWRQLCKAVEWAETRP